MATARSPAGGPVSGNARVGAASGIVTKASEKTSAQSVPTATGDSSGAGNPTVAGGSSARTSWQHGAAAGEAGAAGDGPAGQCGQEADTFGATAEQGRAIRPRAQKFVPSSHATSARSETINRHCRCRRTCATARG